MKPIHYFVAALVVTSTISCGSEQVSVDVTCDKSFPMNGKWAYFFAIYGNQQELMDSCQITNNQFCLSGILPEDEVMCEVLIPQEATYFLVVAQGENIKLHIDSTTRSYFPHTKGSYATNRLSEISKRYRENYGYLDSLTSLQQTLPIEDARQATITDRIRISRQKLTNLIKDAVDNNQSILLAIVAKSWYLDSNPDVSQDSINRVVQCISKRFPHSIHLSTIDPSKPQKRPTQQSILAFNRKAQLKGLPLPYPNGKDESEEPEPIDLPIYQIGDIVAEFSLQDVNGVSNSLFNITSDYTLIDFWASWCAPCKEEVPKIRSVQQRQAQQLTIYAISLDTDSTSWSDAIEKLKMETFTNVRLAKSNKLFTELIARFNVETIPHNFLLDKDHRIIAIDLRGEALEKKMQELTGKQ